jgi:hypothetical protein
MKFSAVRALFSAEGSGVRRGDPNLLRRAKCDRRFLRNGRAPGDPDGSGDRTRRRRDHERHTFFATGGCIARVGARPVFVDIDPETCNISPVALERYLTESCRRGRRILA